MKMSKAMLKEIRVAKGEKALVIVLRKIVKNYTDLDKQDMSVILDIVGSLRTYGWTFNKETKRLHKEGEININLSGISFK